MNIKIEIVNENKAVVTAEIDAATVDKAIENIILTMLKNENGDKEINDEEKTSAYESKHEEICVATLQMLASDVQYNAAMMNRIQPVSAPQIDKNGEIALGKEITMVVSFDIVPKIHLGKYIGVEVTKQEVSVTSDEVNASVRAELNSKKQFITKNTPAELGDTVIIDFEGFVDGVAFEGGKAEKYSLKLGSGTFIPGFEDQLIGKSAGEETDVLVKFPEAYTPELAGKDAVFKIKVHAVQEEKIPVLDDVTVKEISGGKFETVSDYLADKKNELTKKKEDEAENVLAGELFGKICEDSYANVPSSMVENAVEADVKNLERTAAGYGMDVDTLVMYSGAPSLDAYKEMKRDQMKKQIIFSLVIDAIAENEGLLPTKEEVDAVYLSQAEKLNDDKALPERVEELKKKYPPSTVASYIMEQKVYDFVKSNATIK